MAFLHRVVNGGALVHRQMEEGRGVVDLSIDFNGRKYLIEFKMKGRKNEDKSSDN
jgi:hypothetical protein